MSEEVQRIKVSGERNKYVHIGRDVYLRSELVSAFAGDLRTSLGPPSSRKLGNPTPMGLAAFSLSTFFVSLLFVRVRSVTNPIIINSTATYSGLVMILAAMWELALENTYGAVVLATYGSYWLSYLIVNTQAFGVGDAYSEQDLNQALSMYLWCWCIASFLLTIPTIRSTWPFFTMIFFVFLLFLMLACSYITGNDDVTLAGGWIGIILSMLGFYNMMAGLMNYENCYIDIRPFYMPTARKSETKHHSD